MRLVSTRGGSWFSKLRKGEINTETRDWILVLRLGIGERIACPPTANPDDTGFRCRRG